MAAMLGEADMHGHKAQHAAVWLQAVLPVLQVTWAAVCMHLTCTSACISEFTLRRMHPPYSQVVGAQARAAVTTPCRPCSP
jgi:hypothetical protein